MAQSHKFNGSLDDLTTYFPEVPWRASENKVWIFDQKADEYVLVTKGDYVVKIADRFEVTDTEPEKAKPAEPVKEDKASDSADATEVAPNASGLSDSGIRGPLTQTSEEIK